MAEHEAFIPMDCAQSQNAQEAWLALTSHRHLMALSKERAGLLRTHAQLHIVEALTEPEAWEEAHTELLDMTQELDGWIARAKAGIWS